MFFLSEPIKRFFFSINTETKPEEIPESQTNNENNHIHTSSKCRESQGPKKEDTVVAEGKLRGGDDPHRRDPLWTD